MSSSLNGWFAKISSASARDHAALEGFVGLHDLSAMRASMAAKSSGDSARVELHVVVETVLDGRPPLPNCTSP